MDKNAKRILALSSFRCGGSERNLQLLGEEGPSRREGKERNWSQPPFRETLPVKRAPTGLWTSASNVGAAPVPFLVLHFRTHTHTLSLSFCACPFLSSHEIKKKLPSSSRDQNSVPKDECGVCTLTTFPRNTFGKLFFFPLSFCGQHGGRRTYGWPYVTPDVLRPPCMLGKHTSRSSLSVCFFHFCHSSSRQSNAVCSLLRSFSNSMVFSASTCGTFWRQT